MKKFLQSIIETRKVTLFLAVVVTIMGIMSYQLSPKQQSPKINLAAALITTVYPGATAEDIEEMVTSKIEDKLSEFEACDEIFSYSRNSVSVIIYTVQYAQDYTDEWDLLRREMSDLQSELPDGAQDIQIETNFMKTSGLIYAISGVDYTYEELNDYTEILKDELKNIEGISRFEIEGNLDREIVIELDFEKINRLGISYTEIADLIQAQNLEIPSGQVEDGVSKINVRTRGFFESLKDIENIIISISPETGIVTRIKDIGTVSFGLEDTGFKAKINQDNAVLLVGFFEEGKNIIPIGQEIENRLIEIKKIIPNDVEINKILFEPDAVNENLTEFIQSLLQGIVFVVLVVLIGMGLRNAVIVSVAIPLSIFLTFSVMNIFGIAIQQISITALIIALGMLVDNAIVVADAIQIKLDRDEEKMKACVNGVIEVASPVLTSTVTTICTFMPLLLMGGEVGDYLKSMPIVVITALLSSYLVALTVTPTMAFLFFKKRKSSNTGKKIIGWVEKILTNAMEKRHIVFIALILMIVLTIGAVKSIGLKFFPFAQTDMMYIDVHSEITSDLDRTEEVALQVVELLENYEEIDKLALAIGDGMPKFFDTMFPASPSKDYAQILVKVDLNKIGTHKSVTSMTGLRDSIQKTLDGRLSSGTAIVKQLEQGEPVGAPVSVTVTGDDISRIAEVAQNIEGMLIKIEGTSNVKTDFVNKQYEYLVDLDKILASQQGLNNYLVQNEINIGLRGRDIGVMRIEDEEYNLRVKSNIKDIAQLGNIAIKSDITQKKVLLKDIADIELNPVYPVLKKVDQEMSINVTSDALLGYSAVEITDELSSLIDQLDSKGVKVDFSGEKDSIGKNFGTLGAIALLFLLLIYAILLLQFKSFIQPLIILLTIPLSAIGSILGLYITGISLSFTAFLGMVSLAGIVANNAIVLLDYVNIQMNKGTPKNQACIDAAKKRFRPIMLSTLTTIIGLIPLIMMKSELFTPMAVSIMSGLLVSTLLTIIVIPQVTSILMREQSNAHFLLRRIS